MNQEQWNVTQKGDNMKDDDKKLEARQNLISILYDYILKYRPTLKEIGSLVRWIRLTHANI